jgi:hypothetical protein
MKMAKTKLDLMIEKMDRLYGRPKPTPVPVPKREVVKILDFPKQSIPPGTFQAILDAAQEHYLRRQAEIEEEYSSTCHRGPGDPDYWRR